jgi:hypothetical protein
MLWFFFTTSINHFEIDFPLETPGMYPKIVQLNLWGLKIQSYNLSIGQRISAHVNVESKRHHQKWYTTLDIYDIEYLS